MHQPSNNTDQHEISQFDAISNEWWNPQGSFKTLHEINPLRLEFITQVLDLSDKQIIDIGCGGGILTEALAKHGAQVTGIDASLKAIQTAEQHAAVSSLNIHYQYLTAEEMAEQFPLTYDVTTCMELLEHVPDPYSVIESCARLTKNGGDLFFSTINRNLKAYAFAILGAEYVLKLLPKGIHHYEKFIRPSELAQWGRMAGLNLQRIIGISYNPIKKHYRLTQNTDVNYLIHFKKQD